MTDNEKHQKKLLHLLINYHDLVENFVANCQPDYFDTQFKPLVYAFQAYHTRSERLTKSGFTDFVTKACNSGEYAAWQGDKRKKFAPNMVAIAESSLFSSLASAESATKEDYDFLVSKIKEHHAFKQSNEILSKFAKSAKSDIYKAATEAAQEFLSVAGGRDSATANVLDAAEFGSTQWLRNLKERRQNPKERLSTGFPEIDHSIGVGLQPGMLTLFVADTGGFKSTIMLNIALNIFKQSGKNVLFVPLEMPAEMVMHKVVSRETRIPLRSIEHAEKLTDEEVDKLGREFSKWKDNSNKFVMLDPRDRLRVSEIKKLIEQNYSWFKPDIIVVDYISIMRPEANQESLKPYDQLGHMCKDLRQLGRNMNFSVISAAQLSREAIKKLRKEKEGQQSVGSEDLRGSQDLSTDSDNIFAQMPMPSQPNEKLQLFCIKARYGSKTFPGGKPYAVLNVAPDIGRISSEEDAVWDCIDSTDETIQHAESLTEQVNMDDDLSFLDDENSSAPPIESISSDDPFSSSTLKDSSLDVLSDDFDL